MEPKSEQVKRIIREALWHDPSAANSQLAEEISKRAGRTVSRTEISRLRNLIGLGMSQRDQLARLVRGALPSPTTAHQEPEKSGAQHLEASLQDLALMLTVVCVRNTVIEDYHHDGKLSDAEMKAFNIEVANRLYTALSILYGEQLRGARPEFLAFLRFNYPDSWQRPELMKEMLPPNMQVPKNLT